MMLKEVARGPCALIAWKKDSGLFQRNLAKSSNVRASLLEASVHGASSSAPAELICTRTVTVLWDETFGAKKMMGKRK